MARFPVQNILFDWSGTLVDDLPPVLEATNAVMRAFGGRELTRDEFRREFRLPFMHWYGEVLPGVSGEDLGRVFLANYGASKHEVTVQPHVREFLESCAAAGRRMFVLSSTHREAVERQAGSLGLSGYFEHIYAGVHDKREQITGILEERSLPPAETVLIGDMRHDIDAARAGGIASVAVLTGYEFGETLATAGPDLIVSDFAELQVHFPGDRGG
jgi:phosphoglycolate phosphatase